MSVPAKCTSMRTDACCCDSLRRTHEQAVRKLPVQQRSVRWLPPPPPPPPPPTGNSPHAPRLPHPGAAASVGRHRSGPGLEHNDDRIQRIIFISLCKSQMILMTIRFSTTAKQGCQRFTSQHSPSSSHPESRCDRSPRLCKEPGSVMHQPVAMSSSLLRAHAASALPSPHATCASSYCKPVCATHEFSIVLYS